MNKEDKAAPEVKTEERAVFDLPIAYISLGVACSLVVLCLAAAFWRHKKCSRKGHERLFCLLATSILSETSLLQS